MQISAKKDAVKKFSHIHYKFAECVIYRAETNVFSAACTGFCVLSTSEGTSLLIEHMALDS